MPTESSAVSNLLHQLNTRRLRTDPGDDMLFQSPGQARGRGPAPRGQVRWNAPAVAPAPAPAPVPAPALAPRTAQAPGRSQAISWPVAAPSRKTERARPRRRRTWPWIVATLAASVLGIVGASQLGLGDLDDNDSSAAFVVPTLPQPAPPPAITATPVEPPAAAPSEPTAPAAEAAAPAAETAPAEPVAKPVHHAQKAAHSHGKRVAKHVAKASHAAPAAAAEPAEAAPPPPPPAPRGRASQAADTENPL